jgi:hypothetical protein
VASPYICPLPEICPGQRFTVFPDWLKGLGDGLGHVIWRVIFAGKGKKKKKKEGEKKRGGAGEERREEKGYSVGREVRIVTSNLCPGGNVCLITIT